MVFLLKVANDMPSGVHCLFFNFVLLILFLEFYIRSRPLNTGLRLVFLKEAAGCSSVVKFIEKVLGFFFKIVKLSLEEAYS